MSRAQTRRSVLQALRFLVKLTECGTEIPIMRNAGGRVTDDMLTSLELLSTVIDIGKLVVIHHTGQNTPSI